MGTTGTTGTMNLMANEFKRRLPYEAYTVAMVCPLEMEMSAARYMLDEEYQRLPSLPGDENEYYLGQMSGHNVAITALPNGSQGIGAAATAATDMRRTFPNIDLRLLVGIGGGIPTEEDIRLGDVVVSMPSGVHGGVVQYDLGKATTNGWVRKGFLCAPPKKWRTVINRMRSDHRVQPNQIATHISKMLHKYPALADYSRPTDDKDILFEPETLHVSGEKTCAKCDKMDIVCRDVREPQSSKIFYGLIASGNAVMKDAITRDEIAEDAGGALCFEMEAAGLMNDFECIVIRGISDYADLHKNDLWHHYAAAAAAGCAKELLTYLEVKFVRSDQNEVKQPSSSRMIIPFPPDKDFVDREGMMENIDRMLADIEYGPRAALVGLGGIGKSQIAIQFAYRARQKAPDRSVYWVHASSPARFQASYEAIAREVQIPGYEDPQNNILSLVKQWFLSDSSKQWLIIFDNVDDINFATRNHDQGSLPQSVFTITEYLPQKAGGVVLITSRDQNAAFALVANRNRMIHVEPMNQADARKLIDAKIPYDLGSHEERDQLAAFLDHIPLAITQAAAYITRKRRMTIAKYIRLLESDEVVSTSLLKAKENDLRRDPEVPNSVIRTWQVSFEQIQDQNASAADLLALMSMFDKQGIPQLILQQGDEESAFEEAIETLLGYAFVKEEMDGTSFNIHRLVRLATREWLRDTGRLEDQKITALTFLEKRYPRGTYENWTLCRLLEPHIQVLLAEDFGSNEGKLLRANIQHRRTIYYRSIGDTRAAMEVASQCMNDRTQVLGLDHGETLSIRNVLALSVADSGKWVEARDMFLEILETRKRVLGPEDPETHTSMGNLGLALSKLGFLEEAAQLEAEVLETHRKALGPEDPDTLLNMHNLAATLADLGRLDEAEKLTREAFQIRRRVLGPENPYTLSSMGNLAFILRELDRWSEAEKLARETLQIRRRVLGPEHPHTLNAMGILASILYDLDRYDETEKLERRLLEIRQTVLGPEHPDTLVTMTSLAETWKDQNHNKAAIELMKESVDRKIETLGPDHSSTLRSQRLLNSWLTEEQAQPDDSKMEPIKDVEERREKRLSSPSGKSRNDSGSPQLILAPSSVRPADTSTSAQHSEANLTTQNAQDLQD